MDIQRDRVPTAGWLIWHVALRCRTALDAELAPLGLNSSQYGLLASLYGLSRDGAQPTQRELSDFAGLEPMSVSKTARALEHAGLIERRDDPRDTRAVRLTITGKGVELITAARQVVIEFDEWMLGPLGGRRGTDAVLLQDQLLGLLRHLDHKEDQQ